MKAWILVGAPGSGKSTYAERLANHHNAAVICYDDIRARLYGSPEVQGSWSEIWEAVEEAVSETCGIPLVIDGTHFRKDYRHEILSLLRSFGYTEIRAIVLNPSPGVCLARNSKRSRNVPEYVIENMHAELQNSLRTLDFEGFDHVVYTATDNPNDPINHETTQVYATR